MSEVTEIAEHLPHCFFEAMCCGCFKRWIQVARTNVLLKDLECPDCGPGKVFMTGQDVNQ